MLIDETFKPHLEAILKVLPKKRQTLLFSATMVTEYDKNFSKELIFGEASLAENVIECGNNKDSDLEF